LTHNYLSFSKRDTL